MISPSTPPDLGTTGHDRAVSALRGMVGMIPIVGPALVELVNEVIPNQRVHRIEVYLRYLAERLSTVEQTELRARLRMPESIDLFEDGAYQAARAISDERREQLAICVANGIADEDRGYLESKRVLRLIAELDDGEIILLAGYLQKNRNADYRARHANILNIPPVHIGSNRDELDRHTVHEAGQLHLLRLGLLQERRNTAELSPLGRLLLQRIGVAESDEL